MSWHPAPSVVSILLSANKVAPNRSHASDGIIGDATHQAQPTSDHNPDGSGTVHACDVTNDPAHGFDAWHWAHVVAQRIASGLEHRVKYIVTNDGVGPDMIFNPSVSLTWRQNGSFKTEHRSHHHVSVAYSFEGENDTTPFYVPLPSVQVPGPPVPAAPRGLEGLRQAILKLTPIIRQGPVLKQGARGEAVRDLQFALVMLGQQVAIDGDFGPATDKAVRNVQRFWHLSADGVVGPRTRATISWLLSVKFPR